MNALILIVASLAQIAPAPPAPGRERLDATIDGHATPVWGWRAVYPDGQPAIGYYAAENPHLLRRPTAEPSPGAVNYGVVLPHAPAAKADVRTNDREFGDSVAQDLEGPQLGRRHKPCPGPGPCPPDEPQADPARPAHSATLLLAVGVGTALLGMVVVFVALIALALFRSRPAHVAP